MFAPESEKPRAVQSQPRFMEQLGSGRTKFYQLMHNDPRFPRRFKIGGRWVYYVNECNGFIDECAEASR